MKKLPLYLHDRWRNVVLRFRENKDTVTFSHFVDFVQKEAKKANDPVYGNTAISVKGDSKAKGNTKDQKQRQPQRNAFATDVKNESVQYSNSTKCTYCNSSSHNLENCRDILSLSIRNRYEHLKSKSHCFGCLRISHRTANCKNRSHVSYAKDATQLCFMTMKKLIRAKRLWSHRKV